MTSDLISNMLTAIRNASLANHVYTKIQFNTLNLKILAVLKKENYIKDFKIINGEKIIIYLKYKGWWIQKPVFSILKQISTPGKRLFSSYKNFNKEIKYLKYNQGVAIISTSLGVMSHKKALKLKKGGEVLCYIQ